MMGKRTMQYKRFLHLFELVRQSDREVDLVRVSDMAVEAWLSNEITTTQLQTIEDELDEQMAMLVRHGKI